MKMVGYQRIVSPGNFYFYVPRLSIKVLLYWKLLYKHSFTDVPIWHCRFILCRNKDGKQHLVCYLLDNYGNVLSFGTKFNIQCNREHYDICLPFDGKKCTTSCVQPPSSSFSDGRWSPVLFRDLFTPTQIS